MANTHTGNFKALIKQEGEQLHEKLKLKLKEGEMGILKIDDKPLRHLCLVAISTGKQQEEPFSRHLNTILEKAVAAKAKKVGLEPFGTPPSYGYPWKEALTTMGEQICTWMRNRAPKHEIDKYIIYVGSRDYKQNLNTFQEAFANRWKEEVEEDVDESEGPQGNPVDEEDTIKMCRPDQNTTGILKKDRNVEGSAHTGACRKPSRVAFQNEHDNQNGGEWQKFGEPDCEEYTENQVIRHLKEMSKDSIELRHVLHEQSALEEMETNEDTTTIRQVTLQVDIPQAETMMLTSLGLQLQKDFSHMDLVPYGAAKTEHQIIAQMSNWAAYYPMKQEELKDVHLKNHESALVSSILTDIRRSPNPAQHKQLQKFLELCDLWYTQDAQVLNFKEQFAVIKGLRGLHLYTMCDIQLVPYYDSGEPAIGGVYGLHGIEWMPYDGYTDLTPGQHLKSINREGKNPELVKYVITKSQSCALDTMETWIGKNPVKAYHDSGSSASFHTKSFRKQVEKWMGQTPERIGVRTLRARGFFDHPNSKPQARFVDLYKFMIKLQEHGREYEIVSHEMPDNSICCKSLLIGRGSMFKNKWELRYDHDSPYIGANGERSYLKDEHGNPRGHRPERLDTPQEHVRTLQTYDEEEEEMPVLYTDTPDSDRSRENSCTVEEPPDPSDLEEIHGILIEKDTYKDIAESYDLYLSRAQGIENSVRQAFSKYKPTFGEILEIITYDRKKETPTRVPGNVLRLLFYWWSSEMDKEIDHVQSEKLSDFSALDLVKIQKWRDRVDRMAAELNDRYDRSVKENEKVAQHAYTEEEVINKIVSIEDPDVPWVGEMPEDPPEDEQQFFTMIRAPKP